MEWTGAVLVGGVSRRMGRPKQELRDPRGRTWRALALDALARAGAAHLLVVGGEPPAACGEVAFDHVPDLRPGEGPLAGLQAALRAAPTPWCLLVACDMPRLDPACLRQLVAGLEEAAPPSLPTCPSLPTGLADAGLAGPRLAVVPVVEGRLQPLHALYHRDALPRAEAALAAGRRSLTAFVEALPALRPAFPAGPSFLNANTPADLDALEREAPGQDPLTPPRTG